MLGRPAEADPAVAAELLLPRPAFVEALVLVAGAAPTAHRGERSVEPVGEPRARVGAEALLRGSEVQVQAAGRYQSRTRMLSRMEATGIAVVTGAGRGIGRAVAIELAAPRASTWSRPCAIPPTAPGSPTRSVPRSDPGRPARRERPVDDEPARRACACSSTTRASRATTFRSR